MGKAAGTNLTTGSSNIDIANAGVAGEGRTIRIGTKGTQAAAYLAGVSGATIPGPTKAVVVNANGQLGTAPAGAVHAAQVNGQSPSGGQQGLAEQLRRQAAQLRRQAAQLRHQAAQVRALAAQVLTLRAGER